MTWERGIPDRGVLHPIFRLAPASVNQPRLVREIRCSWKSAPELQAQASARKPALAQCAEAALRLPYGVG